MFVRKWWRYVFIVVVISVGRKSIYFVFFYNLCVVNLREYFGGFWIGWFIGNYVIVF